MTYKETLGYLFSRLPMFHRVGPAAYKADLNNTHAIMKVLGHPEKGLKCVHIAGTNGKGSTSHMLASVLQEAGYKTGLFTSPHLKDFRERIRVNGKMISRKAVSAFVDKFRKQIDPVEPSFFEWTAGLALYHFRKCRVDIAVIETGLGGRLDSTNVIIPELSIITNVQWDHMNLLGNTLKKIAAEKAGIIKKGIPVIIGTSQSETDSVFRAAARKAGAPLTFAGKEIRAVPFGHNSHFSAQTYTIEYRKTGDSFTITTPLGGAYQSKNIPGVIAAADLLHHEGFRIRKTHLRKGFKNVKQNTGLKGRWEILGHNPLIIADTGHNKNGIQEIVRQLKAIPHQKLHMVIGMVNDKDVAAMLRLFPKKAEYYFCRPAIPRGLDAAALREEAMKAGLRGNMYKSVRSALNAAKKCADDDDLIFAGGSTFVVAEVV